MTHKYSKKVTFRQKTAMKFDLRSDRWYSSHLDRVIILCLKDNDGAIYRHYLPNKKITLKLGDFLVGLVRFELTASSSRTTRATNCAIAR